MVKASPALMFVTCVALSLSPCAAAAQAREHAVERTLVRTQAELPRFEYSPGVANASDLLTDDAAFAQLAGQLQRDGERLLRDYEIRDQATLRGVHAALRDLALLRGDAPAVHLHGQAVRDLQVDPVEQRFAGTLQEATLAGAGIDDVARRADAVAAAFRRELDAMPWSLVGGRVERLRSSLGLYGQPFFVGSAQNSVDPAYASSRTLGWEQATGLLALRVMLLKVVPARDALLATVDEYIAANRREKPEIWSGRTVSLDGRGNLAPVLVGIWDSGIDPAVFPARMWTHAAEIPGNGIDDDGNGYVDDIHGLGFGGDWGTVYDGQPLAALDPEFRREVPALEAMTQGIYELTAGLDTPAARELQARVAAAAPADVATMMESGTRYMYYSHGTHVAGIALEGNPGAQLLSVRNDAPWQRTPPPFTRDDADALARTMSAVVDYLKAHGARVVNMSWGWTPRDFEQALEANGVGGDATERAALASDLFATIATALREALAAAPGILFVPAAGNSSNDATFSQSIPAGIDLPNVLTAGAVDSAGDMAGFTTVGPTVRVYGNGVAVDSFVPGGKRIPMSGTSMAAPQVTNLAAKLFALDPKLTPTEVVDLILRGATRSDDGKRLLIHPQRSVELLAQRGR